MGIRKMSQTQRIVECNGRKITLIGTAHVSKESVEEVKETIKTINPDCVAVELDEKRADSIQNSEKYKELDIVQVLKRGEGFLLIANLILASFQRKMGQNVGVKPGDEMLAAIEVAKELNIPTALVDRPIQITLRRAWAKNGFMGRIKLLSTLIASAFSKEEVSAEEIEKLKKQSEMDSMMTELAEYMPVIKEVLIDERDKYLATNIWNSQGNNVVAVLGAGHLPGVEAHLIKMSKNEEVADNSEISSVPPKKVSSKIVGWIIVFWGIVMCPIAFLQSANYYPIKNNFFGVEGRMALVVDFLLIGSLIIYSACSTLPILISIFSARMPKNLKEYFYN